MERHPLSSAYPDMTADEFAHLRDSIRLKGLIDPVTTYEGQILDGWHRHLACEAEGVECRYVQWQPSDARHGWSVQDWVVAKNAHRRHLSASQRAAAALVVYRWRPVGNPLFRTGAELQNNTNNEAQAVDPANDWPDEAISAEQIARTAGVSTRTVEAAKVAERAGLGDQVRSGELSAKRAEAIALKKPARQSESQSIRAALDAQEELLASAQAEVATLRARLQAYEDAGADIQEQARRFEALRIDLDTATSQRDDYMRQVEALKAENRRLRKRAGMRP